MGYRLRMSAEIYDWLAELRDSDPPSAELTAQALAALADGGDRLGPPVVTAVPVRPHPDELARALDQHYQDRLELLTAMRRRLAEAAMLRKDLERQLAEPESQHPAGLRARLDEVIGTWLDLTEASRHQQGQVDAFRTRKEVLKAELTVAQAEQLIDPAGAAGSLDEIISRIEQELGSEPPDRDLMELRPGAPDDSGILILFGVEPPGTALLIAALEGNDTIRDRHREAVLLASEALQEARALAAEKVHTFADAQSFLAELFPGLAPETARARFTRSDDLRGAEFTGADLSGARFVRADLSGVVMRGVDVSGADIDSPWLFEGDAFLRVNGVDVIPLVEAELNRRFPGRAARHAADPDGLREAWALLQRAWAAALDRVAAMPAGTADVSVGGEWSFAQTLRHLVFATDVWLGRAILETGQPFHPLGQPDASVNGLDRSVFTTGTPSYAEVLEARADRVTMVRDFLATVTPDTLATTRQSPWGEPYPQTTRSCLHVILDEEWEHYRYAVRDLDAIEATSGA